MKASISIILCSALLTLSVNAATHTFSQSIQSKKFVIGCHGKHAGLFATFFGALNNFAWCEKNNRIPVVYWDQRSLYYTPSGYNGSKNAWEYYFEQPSGLSYQSSDPIYLEYLAPDGAGITLRYDNCRQINKSKEARREVYRLIEKYIRIKPSIMQKVEKFYDKYLADKKTIGVHLRGTDKKNEVGYVSTERILAEANDLARKHPGSQFLVATDEVGLLAKAKMQLKGKVVHYHATRSNNGKPLHDPARKQKNNQFGPPKAQLGEEVLIETLLLSRCNAFVHTCSNVSTAALFFNPELENVLL